MESVYHEGERYIQEEMGVLKESDSLSSMFYKSLPIVAAQFLKTLNFSVISLTTNDKDIFSSTIYSIDSFIEILNDKEILINLDKKSYIPETFYDKNSINIGFIGLDFENAMRIRINGKARIENNSLHININETYSNCPRFIYKRILQEEQKREEKAELFEYKELNEDCKNIIKSANTFFLGTSHKIRGADISHKGGKRGVIKVNTPSQIEFDDFPGNNMYNSLGNIHSNPCISILIIDYVQNRTLHIKGIAKVIHFTKADKKRLKVVVDCISINIESNSFLLKYKD